jgi:hypothetical protein
MRGLSSLCVTLLASCAVAGGSSSGESAGAAGGAAVSPPLTPKAAPAPKPEVATSPLPAAPSGPTLSQQAPTLRVSSCAPCRFTPRVDLAIEIRFSTGADQSVTQLDVTTIAPASAGGAAPAQSLQVTDAWSPSNEFLLQALDLDFDGTLDFAFGPILGTPNLTLHYWRVDADQGRLSDLGSFSNLKVNPSTHELETYEKGGHAGLLFESKVYRWEQGRLSLSRSVEQTAVPGQKGYLKTTRSFDGGRIVKESSEQVTAP